MNEEYEGFEPGDRFAPVPPDVRTLDEKNAQAEHGRNMAGHIQAVFWIVVIFGITIACFTQCAPHT